MKVSFHSGSLPAPEKKMDSEIGIELSSASLHISSDVPSSNSRYTDHEEMGILVNEW
jgi:hypothetical protein